MEEPIVGYRKFIYKDDKLIPLFRDRKSGYTSGINTTKINNDDEGFYAFYKKGLAKEYLSFWFDEVIVVAKVLAFGEVCLHKDGFRAEHLKIDKIISIHNARSARKRVYNFLQRNGYILSTKLKIYSAFLK